MTWSIAINSTETLIWLILFGASLLWIVIYYLLTYWRVGQGKHKKMPPAVPPEGDYRPKVSVVLTAHNEASYLKESLPYLLEQDYPNYEVIVVDYMSQDDTPFVLKVCGENYANFKPILFPNDVNMFQGKKYPLSIGIKSAKGEIILLTEADTVPTTFSWITEMVRGYQVPGVQMVLGYAGIKQQKGLFNMLQQYDNLSDAAYWMGHASMGKPVSATGRNLSYRRDFFFSQGSFIQHYSIPEGADDLFVNQNATSRNAMLCTAEASFVCREPYSTVKQWRKMRVQRAIPRRHHGWGERLLHLQYPVAVVLFYLSFAWLLVLHMPWQYLVAVVAIKIAWQIWAFSKLCKRFLIKGIAPWTPFFEIYFLFSNTILKATPLHRKKHR